MTSGYMLNEFLSHGKACEVARGSLVASLLVPVAMREQGVSSKLLAFKKQLEGHEVGRGVGAQYKTRVELCFRHGERGQLAAEARAGG